ncbi:hypothetical protein [Oerskovia paurometabola]|uniref:Neutral/alkaline non-lysosomal ceramidase n=1 Tax=Oerskovia paurometabola TaxID=162170 RepID=A0ABW1XBX4_9CELL|nr:hypothetical protein [Oerskovia paurometabola]MBM7496235.1 hypothetical protein [Oerskovia paurometabola]
MVSLHDQVKVPGFRGLAGVARRDVTPPVGIRARNWGPADWNASQGTHRAMTLTAIALGQETPGSASSRPTPDGAAHPEPPAPPEHPDVPHADPLVMITVDATWWRRVDDERGVRDAVLAGLGLPPERLLVSLSHTHAGPVLCSHDADLEGGELVPAYLEHLAAQAVDAGREAVASLAPATLEWTTGRCSLAADRELILGAGGSHGEPVVTAPDASGATASAGPGAPVDVTEDFGLPVIGFNPTVPRAAVDDTVVIGRLSRIEPGPTGEPLPTTTPLATIVNYACHPTTLAWQNTLVSPDYVGAMRDLVEESTGAPVAFFQGASGELAPREQYTGDVAVADRHGTSLGHAVLAALAELPPPGTALELTRVVQSGAPLGVWEPRPVEGSRVLRAVSDVVVLELRDLPSLAQMEAEWADIDPRSRDERLRRARNLRDGYVTGPTVQHPTWVWQIGDGFLVAHPGEAYSRFQRTVREHAGDRPVVVANLTNGPGFVYLPTDQAYVRGAYQAWQSPLAPGSLARLEQHANHLIDTLTAATPAPAQTSTEDQ